MSRRTDSGGLFWHIYRHSLMLLLLVALSVLLVARAIREGMPWSELTRAYGAYMSEGLDAVGGDTAALKPELDRQFRHFRLEVSVYDAAGKLTATNTTPPLPPPPGGLSALKGDAQPNPIDGKGWCFATPLRAQGQEIGLASVATPRKPIDFFHKLLLLTVVVLVSLALGSIPLARGIAAPLELLTRRVAEFGAGDLSVRSGISRKDEVGALATSFDVMAARIETLMRQEKALLANVSHELRTPLARIRFALALGADGDPAEAQTYLKEISEDLAELEALVNDVIDTARLDLASGRAGEGAPPLRKTRTQLPALVDEACAHFQHQHPDTRLEVQAEEGLPELEVDTALIRRVLDNLLSNAVRYADPAQPITISLRREPGGVSFAVQDRGPGIEPEALPHLFDPFFRTDQSRTRNTGGVGLGLTLCRRIMEAHGGTLSVTSVLGEGSTFTGHLPLPLAPR